MRLYLLSVEAIKGQFPLTTRLRWRLPDGTVLTEDLSAPEVEDLTQTPGCPWECEHWANEHCFVQLLPGMHYKTRIDLA